MATRIHAPEFPEGFEWIGTPRPLRLRELRGQVVVLDFWTYCCINCMHVLPVLAALEKRRKDDPLVVIGVHSAKFDAETETARIREAMARHGVGHPVLVDRGHRVWRDYTVRSWPTLVVIRPDGVIAATAPGEADFEALDAFVGQVIADAREDGTLAATPFRIDALPAEAPGPLAYPGKVAALSGGRLAVSDSGHHRVLVLDADGDVETVIGSGDGGLVDGVFATAQLQDPQGLAYDADTGVLFIADRGNHALREADLGRGLVRTTAGTGSLGRGIPRTSVPAREMPLRSPWDVALAGDFVLVAMAGTHQIWAISRIDETISILAGSGREGIGDGLFATAAFAQPSGLALDGPRLFVADSETSAVRYLDLAKGEVGTLVGTGLFDFGDADGPPAVARLQHPVGIAVGAAGLLVADTFNDKIRHVDRETGEVRTWFAADADLRLAEPGGLCQLPDGRVVVADTNHHRLVEVSADGRTARVLPVRIEAAGAAAAEGAGAAGPAFTLPAAVIAPGDVTLRLRLEPAAGFDLAEGSRVSLGIESSPPLAAPVEDQGFEVSGRRRGVPVLLKGQADTEGPARGSIDVRLDAVVCSHGDAAACLPVQRNYRIPFRVAASAPAAVDVALPLPDPRA